MINKDYDQRDAATEVEAEIAFAGWVHACCQRMMKSLLFFQVHKSKFGIAQKLCVALPISIDSERQQCPCRSMIKKLPRNRRATSTMVSRALGRPKPIIAKDNGNFNPHHTGITSERRSTLRKSGNISIPRTTTARVPSPPITTEETVPNHAAVTPDSNSPNSFEAPMKR